MNRNERLLEACRHNDIEKVKTLLRNGILRKRADVNFKDKNGDTPLIIAIHTCTLEMVQYLIANGAKQRPLNTAVRTGNVEIVKQLLDNGAYINCHDQGEPTALSVAVGNGNIGMITLLLDNGADINRGNEATFTPLMLAGLTRKLELVKVLVENGANINMTDSSGDTVLKYLTYSDPEKALPILTYLLGQGLDVTIGSCSIDSEYRRISSMGYRNPTEYNYHYNIATLLLHAGRQVFACDKSRLFVEAVKNSDIEMVTMLITEGITPIWKEQYKEEDEWGRTTGNEEYDMLKYARQTRNRAIVELLEKYYDDLGIKH
jgi:hypothetical protein